MKKDSYIITTFIISSLFLIFIVLITGNQISSSPQAPKQLDNCNTLEFHGEGKINLVFFSDKMQTKKYIDFLFTKIAPFNLNKENFNVYYIENYKPNCQIYKNIAILCYSKELVKKAAACPNDYIIVLDKKKSSIRSSSYLNVLSINTEHQLTVFPHELGHAFANLAEEYVPAKLPKDAKNCVSTCEEFKDNKDGCYKGCSKANFIRSIDRGIMRTLSSEQYGIFDENLIQSRIQSSSLSKVTGSVISESKDCKDEKFYSIEAQRNLDNNTINIIDKSLESGCAGTPGYGSLNYTLFDKSGNKILEESFNPDLIFTDAPLEDEIVGEIYDTEEPFLIKVPIVEDAKSLEILHDDKTTKVKVDDADIIPDNTLNESPTEINYIASDFNKDGKVNLLDYNTLEQCYLSEP